VVSTERVNDLKNSSNFFQNELSSFGDDIGEYLFIPCLANPPTSKSGDLE
jgi:hypothetical protein